MLAALSVNTAYAESTLTLGAGVGVIDQPYKGYDSEAYLIPAVSMTATASGSVVWAEGIIPSERCCRYPVGDGLLVADVFQTG